MALGLAAGVLGVTWGAWSDPSVLQAQQEVHRLLEAGAAPLSGGVVTPTPTPEVPEAPSPAPGGPAMTVAPTELPVVPAPGPMVPATQPDSSAPLPIGPSPVAPPASASPPTALATPAPSETCRQETVTDEYGLEVEINECGDP